MVAGIAGQKGSQGVTSTREHAQERMACFIQVVKTYQLESLHCVQAIIKDMYFRAEDARSRRDLKNKLNYVDALITIKEIEKRWIGKSVPAAAPDQPHWLC